MALSPREFMTQHTAKGSDGKRGNIPSPPSLSAKEHKSVNFCFYLRFSFSFWFHLVITFLRTFIFNLLSYHPVCFRRLFCLPTFLSYCTGWIYSRIHTYTKISYLDEKLKSTRSSPLAPTHYSIPVAGAVTFALANSSLVRCIWAIEFVTQLFFITWKRPSPFRYLFAPSTVESNLLLFLRKRDGENSNKYHTSELNVTRRCLGSFRIIAPLRFSLYPANGNTTCLATTQPTS